MSTTELPKPWMHDLWKHLHDEHGLTLLESEISEIVRLAAPVWQPIETAPKSSRSVMIHCSEYRNTYVAENGTGKWRHFGCGRDVMEKPTHWMPLPTPPQV